MKEPGCTDGVYLLYEYARATSFKNLVELMVYIYEMNMPELPHERNWLH